MTLQQLKYVINIVECGSISLAAQKLFITQPSLSKSLADLEKEMGIALFVRNNRGVFLTEEGSRFLSYCRQVVEQADLLENTYKTNETVRRVFAISSQHYAFVINAFVALVKEYGEERYEFSLRESRTYDIIEDVRTQRSELGIIFLSDFNRNVMNNILLKSDLEFISLFTAKPHVFVSRSNPLTSKKTVTMEDLREYPCLSFEQGVNNSFYFSEELHSTRFCPKSIIVSDRATLFNLLIGVNGYTISSGILSHDLNGNELVSIPLESPEIMEIGYIKLCGLTISKMSEKYLEYLKAYIEGYKRV